MWQAKGLIVFCCADLSAVGGGGKQVAAQWCDAIEWHVHRGAGAQGKTDAQPRMGGCMASKRAQVVISMQIPSAVEEVVGGKWAHEDVMLLNGTPTVVQEL